MFPVETRLDSIKAALRANRSVVLTAPPGSGKTTCVPPALLDEEYLRGKKIVMLEPRRLATRNCAKFIAKKMGESVGETVGYQVRLERNISSRTRLEIVTEGLLTQRITNDMELGDVGIVIFDEFHERSLACDTAFALALEVRRNLRPDLRILVMSATLDADEVARHLGDAEIIHAEGRMFPVTTEYLGAIPVKAAISKALAETNGDILCFLPGEGEIKRNLEPGYLPLYGALSPAEQDRVFDASTGRKVILATSIAETSLTLPNVTCVIDSGLMRVPRFSPSTGMSGLVTLPLTLDRAEQRRGRAGRVQSGICYRLWDESQNASRPKKMMPEILDADLCPLVLTCAAWGVTERTALPFLTLPPESAWKQASGLLKLLGALDNNGRITEKGEAMAKLAVHPRIANMLLNGGDPLYAAILEEGVKSRETDIRYVPVTSRIRELAKRFDRLRKGACNDSSLQLLALAYPDRIARNRGNGTFRMVSGRGAFLEEGDPLASEPFLVCCELDDRLGDAKIFLAAPIGASEIKTLFGDKISEKTICSFDRVAERVKCDRREMLGEMVLAEKPISAKECEGTIEALMEGIVTKGVENLPCWTKGAVNLKARINFLWHLIDEQAILRVLPGFIGGMTRISELEKVDLCAVMDFILSEAGHNRRELDRLVPAKMIMPTGSEITIDYSGAEPTVAVRLQECFGLMTTPKVGNGVPIVMTLLSPAHRPIQITKDLAGFWREGYQLVRKDMRGRYPKHYWPEDPLTAVATRRTRPKPENG